MAREETRKPREESEFDEKVVFVNRSSKTTKGGRRMSFSAVVVVGDKKGRVGLGYGKANENADAIRKGGEAARRHLVRVVTKGTTIPHAVTGQCDGGRVLLMPASEGTGMIVGGGMRAVLEMAGIRNVLGKSQGSKNRLNVVKATFDALSKLRPAAAIRAERGLAPLPEDKPAEEPAPAVAEAAPEAPAETPAEAPAEPPAEA
jgi:small subunit ribosomal protein S5